MVQLEESLPQQQVLQTLQAQQQVLQQERPPLLASLLMRWAGWQQMPQELLDAPRQI
jgi:hypothetical protein